MLKFKPILLGVILLLVNLSIAYPQACSDLSILGQRTVCHSSLNNNEYDYTVNYDIFRCATWNISGGTITKINGVPLVEYLADQLQKKQEIDEDYINASATNITGCAAATIKIGFSFIKKDGSASSEIKDILDFNGIFGYIAGIAQNDLKKITVRWTNPSGGSINLHAQGLSFLGICGAKDASASITVEQPVPNFSISSSSGNNLFCNQGTTIGGVPNIGAHTFLPFSIPPFPIHYVWSTNGANIINNWGTGVYIDKFNSNGSVVVTAEARNSCGSKSSSIFLNVSAPNVGNVTQNGSTVGNVIPNCQGNFWLSMPTWVSSDATYTWELPGDYNNQTGEYSKIIKSGKDMRNVQGTLQQGSLVDFNGKATVTGICGPPQVRTFIVKALQSPTIDNEIISCSNIVNISANNPNGVSCNWWSQNGGSFTSTTCQSATFTASGPGEYLISLGTNGPGGCYNQLYTIVRIVGTSSTGTAGWASGVLSDIRERPGSNVVVNSGKVYFTGRDGRIYFYSFDNGTDKWIMTQIPGVSNAKIPASASFTKVAAASYGGNNYLYYLDNGNILRQINLSSYIVTNALGYLDANTIKDFAVNSIGEGFVYKSNNDITPLTINVITDNSGGMALKAVAPGGNLIYNKNNTLFTSASSQLTSAGGILPAYDVVYFNNYVYFAHGPSSGLADLWRVDINTLAAEQITYSGNLTGVFSINPTTGTIYYGVKNPSNLPTVGSGTFVRAEIYQARLVGGIWTYIKTTSGLNAEGSDNYIHGPVFDGNHLFYVGAGGSSATGTQKEIEVWNLFYESACTPSVFRKGNSDELTETESTPTMSAYPNPFDQSLTLSLGNLEGQILAELYNSNGQIVITKTVLDGATIETANLASGLYTLVIKQNGVVTERRKLSHK